MQFSVMHTFGKVSSYEFEIAEINIFTISVSIYCFIK